MENNNKIRTFLGKKSTKNKNIEHHQNFTSSFKNEVYDLSVSWLTCQYRGCFIVLLLKNCMIF